METGFDIEVLKTLKVTKFMCQQDLLFHTRYFFKKQYGRKFVVGDHHIKICQLLERVLKGELTRVIINIAPRYSKTELAVKMLISHGLSLNPAAKFIHLSYSDDLALDNSETVKDLICTQEYQELFPNVQLKPGTKAKDKWYTTAGGGVLARSASGQVTGFGAGQVDDPDMDEFSDMPFGGAIIIDDPVKPEDADSDVQREKVNSRFDSTIRSRVNSRKTPIIIIMQRLHPRDLAGYLQRDDEEDEWTVLELPALILNEDYVDDESTNDEKELTDEELASRYKALWPFKHTVRELLSLRRANEVVFNRQYQQNPRPKAGLMFPHDDLHFYDPKEMEDALDDAEHVYMPVDPANLGGDDFGGIVTKLIGNRIFVTDVIYNTLGSDINEKEVIALAIKERTHSVGVEGIFGWKVTAERIRAALEEQGYEGEFRILRPRTGKHSRINSRSSFVRNHFFFRKDYAKYPQYLKFMNNLTSYLKIQAPGLKNKHDEAPDICEMAGSYYERNFAHVEW